jgi:hypothetical protein
MAEAPEAQGARSEHTKRVGAPINAAGRDAAAIDCNHIYEFGHLESIQTVTAAFAITI